MSTPNQVAVEYEELIQLWDSTVAPQLAPLVGQAPPGWHGYTLIYLFDRFCHFIVVEIERKGWAARFAPLGPGDKVSRQRQFSDFLQQYLPLPDMAPAPEQFRQDQYQFSRDLANGRRPTDREVRDFFLRLHAVSAGSYSSVRREAVEAAGATELRGLLDLLSDHSRSLPARIKNALTPLPNGRKVKQLGASAIAEIPGWLSVHGPRQLPIINGKFVKTLEHLGAYDVANSCFVSLPPV